MRLSKLENSLSVANREKRRLVVPLLGFPGLKLTGSTIKLAQQNYGEHIKVLKAIAETYNPDAVFPLMDLSVEANALGWYTIFPKQESATVLRDKFTSEDLRHIENINICFDTRLCGYVETVRLMNKELPAGILKGAYVTGPYTLAGLLMGADEAALATIGSPDFLLEVCNVLVKKIQDYIRLLTDAGADIICILDPSAVMLGPDQFRDFSANYVNSICNNFGNTGTSFIYHICGNTMHLIDQMARSGVVALSLDSPETGVDLLNVVNTVPGEIIIIGNISPKGSLLYGKPPDVETEVKSLLDNMQSYQNFILSTGCDLPQEIPLENIKAFMDTGRNQRMS